MTTRQTPRESRELAIVATVIAALAVPVFASAVAFPAWDARFVSLFVGSSILVIAAGVRAYAGHPRWFGVSRTGDPLRTSYHRPRSVPAVPHEAPATPRRKVWTREYVVLLVRQTAGAAAVLVLNIGIAVGLVLALAMGSGEMFFVAAILTLAVFFTIGSRFVTGPAVAAEATPALTSTTNDAVLHLAPAAPGSPDTHAA